MPASGWRPFSGGKSLSIGLGGDRHVGDDYHHHMDDVDHHHVSDGDHHHVSDGGHHVGDVPFEAVLVICLSIIFVFVSYWHCIFPWMESVLGTVYSCEHHRAVSLLATPLHSCT